MKTKSFFEQNNSSAVSDLKVPRQHFKEDILSRVPLSVDDIPSTSIMNAVGLVISLTILVVTVPRVVFGESASTAENVTCASCISTCTQCDPEENKEPIHDSCHGWTLYKTESCLKVSDLLASFGRGKTHCENEGGSLLTIKSEEEQKFVQHFLYNESNVMDDIWLGAEVHDEKFVWDGGRQVEYTNWINGNAPVAQNGQCMQMTTSNVDLGKWATTHCNKRLLIVCQKRQQWTVGQLQQAFHNFREDMIKFQGQILQTQASILANPVPIGFVYVQLGGQPEPKKLWPTVSWDDVTSSYSGLFFRAAGGNAGSFGQTQSDNAPRLTNVYSSLASSSRYEPNHQSIPIGGTSSSIWSGDDTPGFVQRVELQFSQSGGEVRPINQAVRIWKRTA